MLDLLRKELLNITFSNTLLKLREFRSKGLAINSIDSFELVKKLIDESKKCSFCSNETEAKMLKNSFSIKTHYTEKELERRLYNTYNESKAFIEERGINALYLTIGALQWYEDENSSIPILSPLLLIPVKIERNVIKGEITYELRYNEETIEPNYTLGRKMEIDFGIKLPAFDETATIDVFFNSVEDSVKGKKRWEVLRNEIRINIFSFLKLMMYHDLDDVHWGIDTKPSNNFLIKNLLSNVGNLSLIPEESSEKEVFDLDKFPANQIDHILDADSSQAEAVTKVFKYKYLVIKGPPGTGKSQTIANIIASCINKGKTVLFVSEKLAALEVVKSRLEKTGLGAACLELHSHKANRKEILENLRQTLIQKTNQVVRDSGELLLLDEARHYLNNYYKALFEPIEVSEITPFDAIGEIVKLRQLFKELPLLGVTNPKWTRFEINEREDRVKSACSFVSQNGNPRNSPFYGSNRVQVGLIEAEELKQLTMTVKQLLSIMSESATKLATKLQLENPSNLDEIKLLLNTSELLLGAPDIQGINIEFNRNNIHINDIRKLFEIGQEFHTLKTTYRDKIVADAHRKNFHIVKAVYETKGRKWFRFIYSDFRLAQKQLFEVLKIKPSSVQEQIILINTIVKKADLVEDAQSLKRVVDEVFTDSKGWNFETDEHWLSKRAGVEFIYEIFLQRKENKVHQHILNKLHLSKSTFAEEAKELKKCICDFETQFDIWTSKFDFEISLKHQLWGNKKSLHDIEQRLVQVINKYDLLTIYCEWNSHKETLKRLGCEQIVEELLNLEGSETSKIFASWRYTVMTTLLDEAFKNRPAINQTELRDYTTKFRETDKYLIEKYNRLKIRYKHLDQMPNIDMIGEPMGILRNEFNKQRRHLTLRKLLEQAGEIIIGIKPVFMMSPLSVAQFLKPDALKFDYVIFDEASQVKPIEAFGALLRGEKAVIVGDDKQLPPSDFFNQVVDLEEIEDEDNYSIVSDMESILDLFATKNAKQTMLNWHYRSKHESLIAVSNEYFYDSKLINLPSAFFKDDDFGLQFRHLPDTVYSAQKNDKEAQYIVEVFCNYVKVHSDPNTHSVGIVAFSIRQKECIENLLMKVRKENVAFDIYMSTAEKAEEPFFVKNLENVQGDERDSIFVSIGYGRSAEGKLNKNFGPVNRTGGERRLNVLFTRARLKCIVFSNFTAGDLSVTDTDPKGLKVFKAFLDYAQNRTINLSLSTNKPTDSPFEESVKIALEKEGYEVHTQIGSAGYFVDLAIPHPIQRGRYLLGIECDGAAYHSSKTARERDRIRQTVLEGLGWKIYRIWSTDWFRHQNLELKKLLDFIAVLKSGTVNISNHISSLPTPIIEQKADNTQNWKIKYQQADVNLSHIYEELHLTEEQDLVDIILKYLVVESPIHEDYIKVVITHQLGIGRIGSRIEAKFVKVFDLGEKNNFWIRKNNFLWLNDNPIEKVRDRSELPEKLRQIEWIAPEEIQLTLKRITLEARAIDQTELMKATLQILNGGIRLTEGIRAIIEREINYLILVKILVIKDSIVRPN